MIIRGASGEVLELVGPELPVEPIPKPPDDDFALAVRFECAGFSGATTVSVLDDEWHAFTSEFTALERDRRGAATLRAIHADRLSLTFRAVDAAGHIAVDGVLAKGSAGRMTTVGFTGIEIDPTELPRILRELLAIAI